MVRMYAVVDRDERVLVCAVVEVRNIYRQFRLSYCEEVENMPRWTEVIHYIHSTT